MVSRAQEVGPPGLKLGPFKPLNTYTLITNLHESTIHPLSCKFPETIPIHSYTENDVAKAILEVTDNSMLQRKAAKKWGIPQKTLSNLIYSQIAAADQI